MKLSFSVVLKPISGTKGKGIITDIKNKKELLTHINSKRYDNIDLMIEEMIKGKIIVYWF